MTSKGSTSKKRKSKHISCKNLSPETIHRIQHENIGRLLIGSFRKVEKAVLEELLAYGFDDIRPTHVSILIHIPPEGIRTTEIAQLAALTKQAVGQIATQLEEMGYLTRRPDPLDGRARILEFTAKGRKLQAASHSILFDCEQRFEDLFGAEQYAIVRSCLKTMVNIDTEAFARPS